ncbi:hypothetical protein [Gimibacter soli]|uniref:Uncharacterized protein n=1 Tax=Gimibacter soli TaxID=3024400 RepID=A0AAE9XVP7_9PROT|nr:hypothetical protein [Gimibacter soli]WCL54798.1 hypothetical protein PH603_03375 [Gimibacter soli]
MAHQGLSTDDFINWAVRGNRNAIIAVASLMQTNPHLVDLSANTPLMLRLVQWVFANQMAEQARQRQPQRIPAAI